MPIISTTPAPASSVPVAAAPTTVPRTANNSLNQQDFLKLLTMQLKNQDPMKPMDENAMVSTMAQFTGLEQSTQMITSLKGLGEDNKMIAASSMIGREVTVTDPAGNQTVGIVDAVENSSTGLQLRMGATLVPFASVTRVAPKSTGAVMPTSVRV
ncbi:MAG: flagellar hook capping FlgD N-terminal domain-containing protein [Opitutaceae bacterium]|jgi:flagellar basal-body rod modification protein FlgD